MERNDLMRIIEELEELIDRIEHGDLTNTELIARLRDMIETLLH